MDQAAKPREPLTPAPSSLLTWPIGVQIALGLLVTAGLFFLLGRWSQGSSHHQSEMTEHVGPALDLNRATRAELRLIPGIGDALAQRVIDHRERNGPFQSVNELRQVAGIGPKTLDRLRHQLFVASPQVNAANLRDPADDTEMRSADVKSRPTPRTSAVSKKVAELTSLIDINRATQAELQKLPGIGPKLSQRILDERAKANFKSIDELRRVPGIGPKTLEKLRPFVTIEEGKAIASSAEE
jgi:competence protein ComEA